MFLIYIFFYEQLAYDYIKKQWLMIYVGFDNRWIIGEVVFTRTGQIGL